MREIKFRAWHKKQKVMFDVGGFANIDYSKDNQYRYVTLAGKSAGVTGDDVTPQIQTVEIMQYTGLKDKNGVEIFEGDVMNWGDISGEVYWRPRQIRFLLKSDGTLKAPTYIDAWSEQMEVIGNIYENPELLK